MYIHSPTHININPTKSIHSKVHEFMVMAESSTFGILHGRNVRGRNVRGRNVRGRNILHSLKTKALMSFMVTGLICVFVFAYAEIGFLMTLLILGYAKSTLTMMQLQACYNPSAGASHIDYNQMSHVLRTSVLGISDQV